MKIAQDDREMLIYFLQEKGDIERWSSWEDRKSDIFAACPDLEYALNQVARSKRFLALVVEKMLNDGE